MKNHTHLVILALSIAMLALLAPTSFAQKGAGMAKAQAIAQQLNLTPQQKEKILPILAAEVPTAWRTVRNTQIVTATMFIMVKLSIAVLLTHPLKNRLFSHPFRAHHQRHNRHDEKQ